MRGIEILNEARIHGDLSGDQLFVGLSNDGSDVIIMPLAQAKDNGRREFDLSERGRQMVQQIAKDNPNLKDKWLTIDEEGARRDFFANFDAIVKEFKPNFDTAQFSPSLLKYYFNSFQQQITADQRTVWQKFSSTLSYSKSDYNLKVYVGFYALQYLHVDIPGKTVGIENRDKRYNTRMGTYSGRDTTYMLIDSDFSIDNDVDLVKTLKSLVGQFPELAEFKFVDGRSGRAEDITVAERLGKTTPVQDLVSKTTGQIFAYHGTSRAILKKIIDQGYMNPGQGPAYSDKIAGHTEHLVYFTLNIEQARKYAVRAAQGREAVIIKAEINDITKLRFDEDGLYAAMRRMPEKVYKNFENLFYKVFNIEVAEKFKSRDNIDSYLRGQLVGELKTFTEPQRKLMSYLNNLVIKSHNHTSGFSFGYKGRLPLEKLTLAETFTSTKYNDNSARDSYSDMYDQVKSTQEFPNTPLSSFRKKRKK